MVFFMYVIRVTLGVTLFWIYNCGHGGISYGKQMERFTVFSSKTFQPRFDQSASQMS